MMRGRDYDFTVVSQFDLDQVCSSLTWMRHTQSTFEEAFWTEPIEPKNKKLTVEHEKWRQRVNTHHFLKSAARRVLYDRDRGEKVEAALTLALEHCDLPEEKRATVKALYEQLQRERSSIQDTPHKN